MRGFIIFLVGVLIGALALSYMKQRSAPAPRPVEAAPKPAEKPAPPPTGKTSIVDDARDAAISAKDAIAGKLEDWHLTGDDIKRDLSKTGEVVRTNAKSAGGTIATAASKARVITVIKTKYALDKELSARSIEVAYDNGKVTLQGTVASEALIGKAVALALDTDGVTEVKSLLTVSLADKP